jgi:hypothetical protein
MDEKIQAEINNLESRGKECLESFFRDKMEDNLWLFSQDPDTSDSYLLEGILRFSEAASLREKFSDKKNTISSQNWTEIQISCDNCIRKYKKIRFKKNEDYFSELIVNDFGEIASSQKAIEAITNLGCDLNYFTYDILFYYAKLYQYRGYAYKQIGKLSRKKVKRSTNHFTLARRDLRKSSLIAILNQLPDQIGLKALRSNKPILNLISDCYIYRDMPKIAPSPTTICITKIKKIKKEIDKEVRDINRRNGRRDSIVAFLPDILTHISAWIFACIFFCYSFILALSNTLQLRSLFDGISIWFDENLKWFNETFKRR